MLCNFTVVCGGDIFSGNCLQNILTIESDGDVYICASNTDDKIFYLGNITQMLPNKILMSKRRISIISNHLKALCKCKYLPICNGGCPLFLMERNSKWCKSFFKYFVNGITDRFFKNSLAVLNKDALLLKSFDYTCI